MQATITREKLYPTPGRSARFAWKWIYAATAEDGRELCGGFDRLDSIERRCREHGYQPVRSWTKSP